MKLWRRKGEMTCQELVELVTDYLEGALSTRDRERFEGHIAQCRHCTAYLDQMRITIRVLGRLPAETLSPAVRAELLETFRGWKRARR
jgi:anti-sigma factor RsiW